MESPRIVSVRLRTDSSLLLIFRAYFYTDSNIYSVRMWEISASSIFFDRDSPELSYSERRIFHTARSFSFWAIEEFE
jgi:hypothetical protein